MTSKFSFDPRSADTEALIRERASRLGDKTFLHFVPDGSKTSYRDLDAWTRTFGHALSKLGVGRGDHVALLLDNCPEIVFSVFSVSRIGAVWVPVNTAARGQLLRYYLELADVKAIVVQDTYVCALREVLPDLPQLRTVIVRGDAVAADKELGGRVQVLALPNRPADEADLPGHVGAGAHGDLGCLLFTSGTTGPSKAVMMPRATFYFYGAHNAHYRDVRPTDIEFVCMPLFHANALLNSVMSVFMVGATVALTDRYSTTRFWSEVRACGATRFNTLGAIANFLWQAPPAPQDRDHQVRACLVAPVPKFVFDFEKRFGLTVFTGYGLSDYCLATSSRPEDPPEKIFTCGQPRDGIEIRIVDDDDMDLPPGAPGEILLRNNHPWGASSGYYKMPEATVESRRNLWFHTGDRGYLDADGYLCFADRKKDAIRRRGENISAYEVESVVGSHPAVLQCAAYAVRAELPEDEVAVSVVPRPGMTFTNEELVAYCAANMSYYMVPRLIHRLAELPMTPTGRIEKYKLRQLADTDRSAFWDREAAGIRIEAPHRRPRQESAQ